MALDRFPVGIQQQVEHLRSGAFTADAINVVAAGKPGVGKRHLLANPGHELILQSATILTIGP